MPKKSSFIDAIKREFHNSYSVVEVFRLTAEASDSGQPVTGFKGLLASAFHALTRSVALGLLFGALLTLKLLLIVVFNVAAVMLLFWLLFPL